METFQAGLAARARAPAEAHSSPAELCARVVGAVRAAARAERPLRRVWALLSRDLLALLCGARTAVMLDYVPVSPSTIQAFLGVLCAGKAGAGSFQGLDVNAGDVLFC